MMERPDFIECNNRCYCAKHFREICDECAFDFAAGPVIPEFELPENGQPECPIGIDRKDPKSNRWLDLERAIYSARISPEMSSHIELPKLELPDEVRNSGVGVRETLLGVFQQLLAMSATQRYFFANQPSIMLQEFETFEQATLLYEANLHDTLDRKLRWLSPYQGFFDVAAELKKKARASLVSAFGFLLELNTQSVFWQSMELTTKAYISLLKSYDQEADDHVLLTEEAKNELLQWIGQVFWSFRHAQHVLNELRKQQHMIYQRNSFPFYPCDLAALKDGLDIHLIIAKLSCGPVHDFPSMVSHLDAFRRASDEHRAQMVHVNYAMMAAIDEMSARFRILELLIRAGQMIATSTEVTKALLCFKFDSTGVELYSTMEDTLTIISEVENTDFTTPTPKNCSILQELLALERKCRIKHRQKFLSLPVQDTKVFTKEMFTAFKSTYNKLYRESIRGLWKTHKKSLLAVEVASRTAHRRAVERKKSKKKKTPSASISGSDWETGDIAEARSVPDETSIVDPALFWATGDGSVERYKPPPVREKIKTRKIGIAPSPEAAAEAEAEAEAEARLLSSAGRSTPSPVESEVPSPRPRSLDQLKESDLTTRDILWRKVKGLVKWSSVVQFLARLGCRISSLDGSKKKVVDEHTGRCLVLHRPHPGDECRRDQLDRYRMQLEDWLHLNYEDVVTPEERTFSPRTSIPGTSLDSSKAVNNELRTNS